MRDVDVTFLTKVEAYGTKELLAFGAFCSIRAGSFPSAAFTPYSTGTTTQPSDETEKEAGEEFRLGTFELPANSSYSGESEQ
jgi:hypothetical protein